VAAYTTYTDSGDADGYSWTGSNLENQFASKIEVTQPSIITDINVYWSGRSGTAYGYHCLWNDMGPLIVNSAQVAAADGSETIGGQQWIYASIADTYLDPGIYMIGVWCEPADERIWGTSDTGQVAVKNWRETATGGIESFGAPDATELETLLAYVEYVPAGRVWYNVAGTDKKGQVFYNVAGTNKRAKGVFRNVNGTWKRSIV
jgi:hypothetical protein